MSGGGILSRRTGTLSSDGKLLFCPCGKQLHIHSAVTGERVGSLSGHQAEVTGVLLNPDSDDQVYTCSMDGTFRRWDFRSGEELQKVTAAAPIKHMVVQRALGVAYLSIYHREGGGRVVLYDIKQGKFSGTAMRTRTTGPLALSATGSLCATVDKHSLFVWRTGTDVHQPLNLTHTKPYTCVAFSSDDSVLAAGDMSGRILIYRSFHHHVPSARREGEHSGKHHPTSPPPLTTVHWHAHPVGCLAFSPDGTYLLSGGAEGVLVMWTLETNRPNFLPRLGGPLIGIHPSPADPARYVLRQADNVVRIVNTATMKVEASIMGLRPPPLGLAPPAGVGGGAAAVLAPGRGAGGAGVGGGSAGVLVVPCENAQLQFYDVARDRHVALVQVAPRNAVSLSDTNPYGSHSPYPEGGRRGGRGAQAAQPDPAASTVPPFVALVALSGDGSAMATVDLRPDGGPYGSTEACLKFWDATSGSGSSEARSGGFLLNTRVDEPHRDHVACLAYHPTRHVAVTTGGSGAESEYKLWVREQRSAPGSGRRGAGRVVSSHWRCLATGGYKGLPLGPAAFSPGDGSVLAVAAHSRVTLWDSSSSALAAVLPAPPADEHRVASGPSAAAPLTQLAFVPGTPFLAAASATSLTVYNILTAAVHWSLPYGAVSLSADPLYGLLAAALPATPPLPTEAPAAAAAPSTSTPAGKEHAAAAAVVIPVPPSCHVLVLDPRDATPRYHCHVPGARAVHLAHLTSSSAAAAADGKGCSPLLMLRDNRQYSIAAPEGTEDGVVQGLAATGLSLAREQDPNAFEAAFGKQTAAAGAAAGQGPEGPSAMEVDSAAVGGKPRWAELFDAPSHVLPPPSALASAFLTLLTTAPAGGTS